MTDKKQTRFMPLWVGNAGGRLRRNKFSIKPRLVFDTAGSTTKRRVPHPLRSWQRVGYATAGIEIRGIPPFAKSAKDGAPGSRKSGYALSKNISKKGPRNCRSLGCARDDKGEGGASIESGCSTEGVFHLLGWAAGPGRRPMTTPVGRTKGRATLPWRVVAEQKPFSSPWVGRRPIHHSGPTARRDRREDKV
jgi:hypothetical protein